MSKLSETVDELERMGQTLGDIAFSRYGDALTKAAPQLFAAVHALETARLILAAGVSCDAGADCRPCEAMREAMHAIGEALGGAA